MTMYIVNLAYIEIPYGKGFGAQVFKGSVTNGHNRNLQGTLLVAREMLYSLSWKDTLTFPQDSVDGLHNELEPKVNQSKKRKRVSLQDTDHSFSPSSEEPESKEQGDDEDFEDSSLRNRKKLKLQHGHSITEDEFPQMLTTAQGVIYYHYKGQDCDHLDGNDHGIDPHADHPSNGLIIQENDLNGHCAALKAFSMSLCRPAHSIFCSDHKLLLLFSSLESHL